MRLEPRLYAIDMKQMFAWKLVDVVFVLEVVEAYLAVGDVSEVVATDYSKSVDEFLCGWYAIGCLSGCHELVETLLQDVVQVLVAGVITPTKSTNIAQHSSYQRRELIFVASSIDLYVNLLTNILCLSDYIREKVVLSSRVLSTVWKVLLVIETHQSWLLLVLSRLCI